MTEGIRISRLNKSFGGFSLKNIELTIPRGYVTAIVGNNGAGKTTLLKCITGSYIPDSGTIDFPSPRERGRTAVIFDECPFRININSKTLSKSMDVLFDDWNNERFVSLCERFRIDMGKKIGKLSKGTKMKLQAAVAFSHDTDILVMDEATAGLDPDAKMDLLDMVRDYITREDRTVIMSSHIISDLEKIADYVVFINDGEIVLSSDKETLSDEFGILHTVKSIPELSENIVYESDGRYGKECLIRNKNEVREAYPELIIDDATLEDIAISIIRSRK